MGESLSWERPPKVLLGHILNGFKSLLGKKKTRIVWKREEEGRGKNEEKETKLPLGSNIIYSWLSKQKNVGMTDDWYKWVKQG